MANEKAKMGRPRLHQEGEVEPLLITLPKARVEWLRKAHRGKMGAFIEECLVAAGKRKKQDKKAA